MKIPKRKKNDRAAFYNLPTEEYDQLTKKERRKWRKPDVLLGNMLEIMHVSVP